MVFGLRLTAKWSLLCFGISLMAFSYIFSSNEPTTLFETDYGLLYQGDALFPMRFIVTIISKYDQFEKRNAIRDTWGNRSRLEAIFGKTMVHGPLFFIGQPPNNSNVTTREMLIEEQSKYGDVVVVNSTDTFRELTPKMFKVFNWLYEEIDHKWKFQDQYLQSVNDSYYILKADDDCFIDLFRIAKLLYGDWRFSQMSSKADNLFYCNVIRKAYVDRNNNSKLYVPTELYRLPRYPTYCSGIAYMFDTRQLNRMLETGRQMPQLPNEDTFFTGTVAARLRLRHRQIQVKEYFQQAGHWNNGTLCRVGKGIDNSRMLLHRLSPIEMRILQGCYDIWWKSFNNI